MLSTSKPIAIASLLITNIIPLVGVLWGGWSSSTILLVYWFESAVIGFFTLQKIRIAEQTGALNKYTVTLNNQPVTQNHYQFLSVFFLMHYGIFMFVHLIFLLVFFLRPSLNFVGLGLSALSVVFSHFVSYQQNFITNKEYQHKTADYYFWSPYPRVIAMHVAVILGAMIMFTQGQSVLSLAVLVIVKTISDLGGHLLEHVKKK
jgi:hypothetical protein